MPKKQKQQASYEGPDDEDKKILEKLEKEMEDTMDVDEENDNKQIKALFCLRSLSSA